MGSSFATGDGKKLTTNQVNHKLSFERVARDTHAVGRAAVVVPLFFWGRSIDTSVRINHHDIPV